jgi:transcriptional regulator with XRE-family HTH domain
VDRRALADFLRRSRERVTPADVGLPAGTRRRTPGLRREEVAQLAHISTEYYTRLEQARGPHPSRRVLTGIERALRLSEAERAHLFFLAGEPPGPPPGPSREVRASLRTLIDRLPDAAAIVVDASFTVIGWNALATALMEDFSALEPRQRNLVRRHFLHPDPAQRDYNVSGRELFAVISVAALRSSSARYPDDTELAALVKELRAGSAEFERLWMAHDVGVPQHIPKKVMRHPVVGEIRLNCDVLHVPADDQVVIIFTAEPGSSDEQALQLLKVVGTQRLDESRYSG